VEGIISDCIVGMPMWRQRMGKGMGKRMGSNNGQRMGKAANIGQLPGQAGSAET